MPDPVTADDVLATAELTVAVLDAGRHADWSARAGDLDWTCWETVEHLADDWFDYAAQLGVAQDERVPFEAESRSAEGPPNTIRAEREEGVDGLIAVCRSTAFLHAAVVRAAPPTARDHHVYGIADPEASAAMGVVEGLVHTHDVATGLGVPFTGDAALAAKVLHRVFPDVARTDDAWADLCWATGRLDRPDRPRRTPWRWWNDPSEYKATL